MVNIIKEELPIEESLSKKFSNVEIVSYLLVKRLVHCIILKRSNFTTDEIAEIINRIF